MILKLKIKKEAIQSRRPLMPSRIKKKRVSLRVMHMIRSETLSKTLWREKSCQESRISPRVSNLAKSLAESLGSDHMHDSRRHSISPQDSFFYAVLSEGFDCHYSSMFALCLKNFHIFVRSVFKLGWTHY